MAQLTKSSRILSIDILRALTMMLMIFVNDLWSLKNIPQWLVHTAAEEDAMGLADVVFPAFLFIVGMSLPFAVVSRIKKGDSEIQIIRHIATRSFSLIVMGIFLVNGENISQEASGIPRLLWNVLSCLSFILLFNTYSENINKIFVRMMKATGVLILVVLGILYRGGEGAEVHGFDTYWWGILGLIGWAYLICGIAYVLLRRDLKTTIGLWIVFNLLCVGSHADWISDLPVINFLLSPFAGGAMPAFVIGGAVISHIHLHYRDLGKETKMLLVCFAIAAFLLFIGFWSRPLWGISKIRATPSWVWICSAITICTFTFIYWLTDIKKRSNWFTFIKPAGTNTLLCYLIPYFAYALVVWSGVKYPELMLDGMIGLIKSLVFALLVVWIAGLAEKNKLQLKL